MFVAGSLLACVHSARLQLVIDPKIPERNIGGLWVPEKEPPRTTTTWRFEGATGEVEERRAAEDGDVGEVEKRVLSEFGGSLEWRSMAVGRSSCSAGSTLTDIFQLLSRGNYQ
jgi:hypothetical protein